MFMKKRIFAALLCASMVTAAFTGCSGDSGGDSAKSEWAGETLSILVSSGWMDNRWDDVLESFEEEYGVTVDLQTIPADQYPDLLQSKLTTDSCADVFWIQSNPFAIESVIVNPEEYCIDFSGAEWESLIPEARLSSCKYEDKLYGLQIYNNSPDCVMVYNKSMFEEHGWEVPATYDEFKELCGEILDEGITPWYMPGADGWQHQLTFFQIGGVYEQAQPGLYEALNTNQATFAGNEQMITALEQFKEFSDLGYFGEDWIGTDSSNLINAMAEREAAMVISGSGVIKQIRDDTGSEDEFGMFLEPFVDNQTFPTNPSGPTMFGYNKSEHPDLVKEYFNFVTKTENLQSILDNSPTWTNLDILDDNLEQHWLPEEEEFMSQITDEQKATPVLQTGTKYTNDYWNQFGQDMVAYVQGTIDDPNVVLENMDKNRAEAAKTANDPNWQ